MTEELVKKAINYFGEVWPSDAIAIGVCIQDHGENVVGDIDFLYAGFDRNLWHRFCNENEFEHYVANLKPMKNADMPAMPINTLKTVGELSVSTNEHTGLTKREHLAGLAMQGIISSGNLERPETLASEIELFKRVSVAAISYADALLEELSK